MDKLNEALEKAREGWLREMAEFKNPRFDLIKLPQAPLPPEECLVNCRVLPNRESILRRMQTGSVCAEVGVLSGDFSQSILRICQPKELHLIDIDLISYGVLNRFAAEIADGMVFPKQGDSSLVIKEYPDYYFDFIYIDADHTYEGVKRDIQASIPKLKNSGFLIFNDYTYWSPAECKRYGVMQAVNELCIEANWEMIYFALEPYMYCDVALRRQKADVIP